MISAWHKYGYCRRLHLDDTGFQRKVLNKNKKQFSITVNIKRGIRLI